MFIDAVVVTVAVSVAVGESSEKIRILREIADGTKDAEDALNLVACQSNPRMAWCPQAWAPEDGGRRWGPSSDVGHAGAWQKGRD